MVTGTLLTGARSNRRRVTRMSPPSRGDVRAYLSDGESILSRRVGRMGVAAEQADGVIAATDRRLVFRSDDGAFREIRYDSIRSIEAHDETRLKVANHDYRLVVGGSAAVAVLAFAGAIGTSSGLFALVLVMLAVAGIGGADYGLKRREEYDGLELAEHTVRVVVLTTEDGSTERIELSAGDEFETKLSQLARSRQ